MQETAVNASPATATNHCGTCSLCCKVKAIGELAKPMYTWCGHCQKGKGCKLYDTPHKPASCTEYTCLWLATQSFEDTSRRLSLEFRPDRTKVVVDTPDKPGYKVAIFWPDPDAPGAMRSEQNRFLIEALSTEYAVIEARGRRRKLLAVDPANARHMVESGYDPSITEWEV
jgi:hypothetical protein